MPKTYPGLFSDGVDAEKRIISQHFARSTKLTDSNFRILSQKINFRFVFACGSSSSGSGQRPRGIRFSACSGGRRVVQTHPVELRARSTPLAPPAGGAGGAEGRRRDAARSASPAARCAAASSARRRRLARTRRTQADFNRMLLFAGFSCCTCLCVFAPAIQCLLGYRIDETKLYPRHRHMYTHGH